MINLKALEKANRVSVTYTIDDIDSEYVKSFRKKHKLSQTALANLMGVCQTTVMHWESGKSKVNDSCAKLFTLFSKNCNLINDIRKVEFAKSEKEMKPLTITKDEFSGKWVAWHLPSDKIVEFKHEIISKAFWACSWTFYLIGVGETKEEATKELEKKLDNFFRWLSVNKPTYYNYGITTNLPKYRAAIYEFNTQKLD